MLLVATLYTEWAKSCDPHIWAYGLLSYYNSSYLANRMQLSCQPFEDPIIKIRLWVHFRPHPSNLKSHIPTLQDILAKALYYASRLFPEKITWNGQSERKFLSSLCISLAQLIGSLRDMDVWQLVWALNGVECMSSDQIPPPNNVVWSPHPM